MPDQHFYFFADKDKLFGEFRPDIMTIYISINSSNEGPSGFGDQFFC